MILKANMKIRRKPVKHTGVQLYVYMYMLAFIKKTWNVAVTSHAALEFNILQER